MTGGSRPATSAARCRPTTRRWRQDPRDFSIYYRAGVALSHLGDHEQAATLFTQVIRMGPADREEVRSAPRQWLEAAGRLPADPPAASPPR